MAVDRLLPDGQQNLFGEWSIADTDLAVMLNRWYCMAIPCPRVCGIMLSFSGSEPLYSCG